MKFIRKYNLISLALGAAVLYVAYRYFTGRAPLGAGHLTPADAISYGWAVSQAGLTGWLETSPDGATNVMHDTGWENPYATP